MFRARGPTVAIERFVGKARYDRRISCGAYWIMAMGTLRKFYQASIFHSQEPIESADVAIASSRVINRACYDRTCDEHVNRTTAHNNCQ
jgi:hypothetical protein